MSSSGKPLSGLVVLEVGSYLAGPFCGSQLADLGAQVIKVEDPARGDELRHSSPKVDGTASVFIRTNRNKRSIALDLKHPDGKAVFRQLAADCDVVIENMRPGAMARLDLDWPQLREINSRLVYAAVSGFGRSGPYADFPGLDIIAQGLSGLMSITGEPGGPPAKAGVPVCDLVCALYTTIAVLAALRERESTGRGQLVETSLFEAGASLTVWEAGRYFATGEVPQAQGSAHQSNAPYQAIRGSDGFFTVGATTDEHWRRLMAALGLDDLASDPAFATNADRFGNRPDLIAHIEAVTTAHPRSHWLDRIRAVGVPCGPVLRYDEVTTDPHLTERGFFVNAPHAVSGELRMLGSAMLFDDVRPGVQVAAPVLGEHTAAILKQAGLSDDAAAQLIESGVAGTGSTESA
jgi:crotonobetainyl-CoA:carnitine CoA-transferase CaiB-like acyl-CoA transferase